jgi:hypothetical protein
LPPYFNAHPSSRFSALKYGEIPVHLNESWRADSVQPQTYFLPPKPAGRKMHRMRLQQMRMKLLKLLLMVVLEML